MAGHSKWKNIMHKKAKTDAQRAKVFTKIGKEIAMAVKNGGGDPNVNGKLRDLILKAKSNNVPNDNIERVIKKAEGNDGSVYEEVFYEGYGIGGVAVIVKATTDNRNRTAGDMRHYFDKFGGNLGTTGCVSFMFEDKGLILVDTQTIDQDKLLETALEAGAEDCEFDTESAEITTAPNDLEVVREELTKAGYTILSCQVEKLPSTYTALTDEEQLTKLQKMFDMLDDNEDVSEYWHNLEE